MNSFMNLFLISLGKTQVASGTNTVLAVGPGMLINSFFLQHYIFLFTTPPVDIYSLKYYSGPKSQIDKVTGKLKLL